MHMIILCSISECDTKKKLFVNTSDTVVFSVDFNEIGTINALRKLTRAIYRDF